MWERIDDFALKVGEGGIVFLTQQPNVAMTTKTKTTSTRMRTMDGEERWAAARVQCWWLSSWEDNDDQDEDDDKDNDTDKIIGHDKTTGHNSTAQGGMALYSTIVGRGMDSGGRDHFLNATTSENLYCTIDLNSPPLNWGQFHRDPWWANHHILWLR